MSTATVVTAEWTGTNQSTIKPSTKKEKAIQSAKLSKAAQQQANHHHTVQIIREQLTATDNLPQAIAEQLVETQHIVIETTEEHTKELINTAFDSHNLATKKDLKAAVTQLDDRITRLENRMTQLENTVLTMKKEFKHNIELLEARLEKKIAEVYVAIAQASNKNIMWTAGLLLTSGIIQHLLK